jgi:hypothetical protein
MPLGLEGEACFGVFSNECVRFKADGYPFHFYHRVFFFVSEMFDRLFPLPELAKASKDEKELDLQKSWDCEAFGVRKSSFAFV